MAELTKGTVLVATPCEVVVGRPAGDGLVWSWCRTCCSAHVIDAASFKAGNGPWQLPEEVR